MKILITGGMGFIGSHLAEKLVKKHKIILLTRSLAKKQNISRFITNVIIEKVDINNHRKIALCIEKYKPDIIIHLAGETSHSKSFENPVLDIESNAKSTLVILEKIRQLKLKCRFILGSSFIVVGPPKKLPVDEETPCSPTTIYGANRLLSEQYCKIYKRVYNIDTVIFRITNSYGPREQVIPNKNAINFLIYQAYKGKNVTIFNEGKFYRDLIYVTDVVNAILTLIKRGKSGELYWISSNKKLWFKDLGKILENLTKTKTTFVSMPNYTKKVDVGNFVVNNSKLRKLGWKPKIPIEEGIVNTLNYFKEKEGKNTQ